MLATIVVALAAGARPAFAQAQPVPSLGLGTAGGPFGPAIGAGDFNGDGALDLAVADVVGGRPGQWTYRISLGIRGHRPRRATFVSPQPSLTLRLADVDGDHDLDIVAVVPVMDVPAAVWLNDGRGHFVSGDIGQYSKTPPSRRRLAGRASRERAPTPGSISERTSLDGRRAALPVPSSAGGVGVSTTGRSFSGTPTQLSPRGPPFARA